MNTDNDPSVQNSFSQKDTIIVVGDLFIDENWLMANENNYSSTNVGKHHYVSALKETDSQILSLCGIANVLKVFGGANNFGIKLCGVGAWNPSDQKVLECMLCKDGQDKVSQTPYTLIDPSIADIIKGTPHCGKKPCDSNIELINLVKAKESKPVSTNRLFRIYEGYRSDQPRLISRCDWTIPISDTNESTEQSVILNPEKLDYIKNVRAVVIVDHGKGVICDKVIKKLLEKYGDVNWYARVKMDNPDWFTTLRKKHKRLRLIVTDQQLIQFQYGIRSWAYGSILGRGSLEAMGDMLGLKKRKHLTIEDEKEKGTIADIAAILLEDNSTIIGCRKNGDDNELNEFAKLAILPPPERGKLYPIHVGRTSIFFISLIYLDIFREFRAPKFKDGNLNSDTMYNACEQSQNNVFRWTRECTEAWKDGNLKKLMGPFDEVCKWLSPVRSVKAKEKKTFEYKKSWDEWDDSSKSIGLIAKSKIENPCERNKLQLWRASGLLAKYICPGGRKRSEVNKLIHSLNEYCGERYPNLPYNNLFLAKPGWGKSYLANCLAEKFDMEFLKYSLAEMTSAKDLTNAFKEVVSTQNRKNKKVLVFIDEIDAKIGSDHALGLLLGPMWNSAFKIEGNTYKIDPCVWVFASSKSKTSEVKSCNKGPDFLSRINGYVMDLDYLSGNPEEDAIDEIVDIFEKDKSELGIELVYHGVNFLIRSFGPIVKIDECVLELFRNIQPTNGVRSVEIFVSKFQGIKMGEVREENVPDLTKSQELKRHIKLSRNWDEIRNDKDYKETLGSDVNNLLYKNKQAKIYIAPPE